MNELVQKTNRLSKRIEEKEKTKEEELNKLNIQDKEGNNISDLYKELVECNKEIEKMEEKNTNRGHVYMKEAKKLKEKYKRSEDLKNELKPYENHFEPINRLNNKIEDITKRKEDVNYDLHRYVPDMKIKIENCELPIYFDTKQPAWCFKEEDLQKYRQQNIKSNAKQTLIINEKVYNDNDNDFVFDISQTVTNTYVNDKGNFINRNKFVDDVDDTNRRLEHILPLIKFSFGICELYCYFKNKQIDEINRKRQEFEEKLNEINNENKIDFFTGEIKDISNKRGRINNAKEQYTREFDRITGGCCCC